MAQESRTAVVAALLGNLGLVGLKSVAAVVTGSPAMVAETLHSVADTGNQGLLMVGMRMARRPPDARHPFGYGTNVYFWAFVVAMMLFTLGGAFAMLEAVRNFLQPHGHESYAWAWGVLAGALVFESGSLAVAARSLRREAGARGVRQFLRESRDPTLITVLLEDAAALGSILVAAGGIALAQVTGNPRWDAAASAVIGLLLLGVAVVLALETHSLLIGEAAPPSVQDRIRAVVERDDDVTAVVTLDTMHIGPETMLVAIQAKFREGLTLEGVTAAIPRLEERVRRELAGVTSPDLIFIEPARAAARRAA